MVFGGNVFLPMATLTKTVPVIAVGGLAKQFLIPGWRVGWITVHDRDGALEDVRTAYFKLSQLTLGANSLVQVSTLRIVCADVHVLNRPSNLIVSGAERHPRPADSGSGQCGSSLACHVQGVVLLSPGGQRQVHRGVPSRYSRAGNHHPAGCHVRHGKYSMTDIAQKLPSTGAVLMLGMRDDS